jgi:hypothetical protein
MIKNALAMVDPQVGVVKDATMNGCTKFPKALQRMCSRPEVAIAKADTR